MKRTSCLFLALVLLFSLAVPVMAADAPSVTLTADNASVAAGEDITLTLAIDQPISNLNNFQFDIGYNGSLFTFKEGSIGSASTYTQLGDPGVKDGNYYVSVLGGDFVNADPIALSAGVIATLTFTANADAAGDAAFSILHKEIQDYDTLTDCTIILPATPVSIPVTAAPAAKGYTVTAEADKTANVGESVSVSFTVGNTEAAVTEYNAYDLTLTYDTAKLSYVSATAADADANISDKTDGTLRVIGYGENKALGTAVVTLNFTTLAAGEAHVKATAANVDNRANAPDKDTPAATLTDDTTVITVAEKYNVTLGEGLTADDLVAESGKDYTFSATDYENYDYVVTATINGSSVTVTDNSDGTYTIPGASITGPITVSATRTGKEQTVTVEGSGAADVEAEPKANYGTDYTFTVNKQVGYKYTVTVTVDGATVTADAGENSYTIPGAAITGPVVIAVTRTMEGSAPSYTVTKPAWVSGTEKATAGENYTFTITTEAGYTYSEPEVTVGGKTVTITKNNDGTYTIEGKDIAGDVIIKVTRTSSTGIAVREYITLDEKSMYLITVSNVTGEDNIAKYAGNSMYWSPSYNAYAWLVVSDNSLAEMETEAANNVTVAPGTAAATIAYAGDVNMTTKTDVNDAQLTYDMYKARYDGFDTVSMEKFLRADVNGSRTVDTSDAAAIVAAIQTP